MPTSDFVSEIEICLVLLDGAAKRSAGLHPRVRRIRQRAEWIHRLKIPVAQESEDVAMKIVGARSRNDVDDTSRSAAIFRRVTIGNDLEFLHRFLRHGRTYAVRGIVG